MNEKIIEDVHVEWHPEQGIVKLIAENLDGSEFLLDEFAPLLPPSFADESIPVEDSDYEEYYNEALKAAHKAGYVLAGESDESTGDRTEEDIQALSKELREFGIETYLHEHLGHSFEAQTVLSKFCQATIDRLSEEELDALTEEVIANVEDDLR